MARGKTTAALLAITWVTGSWWVHDNLHMHVGMNVPALMAIEYGFHVTVGLAGLVLGYLFIDAVKNRFQFRTPDSSPYETDQTNWHPDRPTNNAPFRP